MKRIVIIICYYGTFPWYFAYFLHSCCFNPTIDFLIFTDQNYKDFLPSNVKIELLPFNRLKTRIAKQLGERVTINFPYKLCDFKPAIGYIFSDYISEYDFWGQSDLDVIYGNIRTFLNEHILNKFDFISVRHDYATGCFTVSKNCKLINTIFKRSRDWRKVIQSKQYLGFDEFNFQHTLLNEAKSVEHIKTEIETYTHIIKRANETGEIKAFFDFIMIEGVPGNILFDNGKIIYKRRYEAILYHLFWLKKNFSSHKVIEQIPIRYNISSKKIY